MAENTEKSCPQARQCKYRGADLYTVQILFTTLLTSISTLEGEFGEISGTDREGGAGEWRNFMICSLHQPLPE
jgi:hypothetical protein